MEKKEQFKNFVKENPRLMTHVKNGDMTWQKFYEIYDLYGASDEAWSEYLTPVAATAVDTTATTGFTLGDLAGFLKNINLDSIQEGVGSVQRVLGVLQDFSGKDQQTDTKEEYTPRPLYKHFED